MAWPILKEFGYPFTMFIYTDYVKGKTEIRRGNLSLTRVNSPKCATPAWTLKATLFPTVPLNAKKGKTDEQYLAWLKGEIAGSKEILERNLGIPVKAFAYPYGLYDQSVRDVVKQTGYEAAFTVWGRRIAHGADSMTIGRYGIESTKPKVFEEALNFTGGRRR